MAGLWYPGKPAVSMMKAADEALREFYGPALREQLSEPSAFTHIKRTLHVAHRRWWEAERRTITWHVATSRESTTITEQDLIDCAERIEREGR